MNTFICIMTRNVVVTMGKLTDLGDSQISKLNNTYLDTKPDLETDNYIRMKEYGKNCDSK